MASALGGILDWVIIFLWCWIIWEFIRLIFFRGGQKVLENITGSEHYPNFLGRMKTKVLSAIPLTGQNWDYEHARREETRVLNSLITEQNEKKMLEALSDALKSYGKEFHILFDQGEILSKNHLETMQSAFLRFLDALEKVNQAEHKWKRNERREVQEFNRLMVELKSKRADIKVIDDLATREKLVLDLFSRVAASVKKMNEYMQKIQKPQLEIEGAVMKLYADKRMSPQRPINLRNTASARIDVIDKNLRLLDTEVNEAIKNESDALTETATMQKTIFDKWARG